MKELLSIILLIIYFIHFGFAWFYYQSKVKRADIANCNHKKQFKILEDYLKNNQVSTFEKYILKFTPILFIGTFILFTLGSSIIWAYNFFIKGID